MNNTIFSILFFSVALVFSARYEASFTLPKLVYLYSCTLALAASWLYAYRKGHVHPIPSPVLYFALAFALWLLLSTTFAIHVPTAVFGVYGRWQGLLTHLAYVGLSLMAATLPLDRHKTLKAFVLAMLCVAVVAITQRLNFVNSPILGGRSFSTIGNAIPMAACLALAIPFALYFAVRGKWRTLWVLIALILLAGIIVSESRGPELGLLVALSIMLAGALKRKNTAIIGIAIIIGALLFVNPRNNISNITKDTGFTYRIMYSKAALGMIKDYPIFGVGLENYRIAYPKYRTAESRQIEPQVIPTKAHNGYLQYAATTGILGLIYYLILVGACLRSVQTEDRLLRIALVAAIAGYLVQDMTGWEDVSLTSFFYITLGIGINKGTH